MLKINYYESILEMIKSNLIIQNENFDAINEIEMFFDELKFNNRFNYGILKGKYNSKITFNNQIISFEELFSVIKDIKHQIKDNNQIDFVKYINIGIFQNDDFAYDLTILNKLINNMNELSKHSNNELLLENGKLIGVKEKNLKYDFYYNLLCDSKFENVFYNSLAKTAIDKIALMQNQRNIKIDMDKYKKVKENQLKQNYLNAKELKELVNNLEETELLKKYNVKNSLNGSFLNKMQLDRKIYEKNMIDSLTEEEAITELVNYLKNEIKVTNNKIDNYDKLINLHKELACLRKL